MPGTNVALLKHTVGFDELRGRVAEFPPERAGQICDVDAHEIRRTARLLGTAERLLSTVL